MFLLILGNWVCHDCTLINSPEIDICQACCSSRKNYLDKCKTEGNKDNILQDNKIKDIPSGTTKDYSDKNGHLDKPNGILDSIERTCINLATKIISGSNELKEKNVGKKIINSLSNSINSKMNLNHSQQNGHLQIPESTNNNSDELQCESSRWFNECVVSDSDDNPMGLTRQKSMKSMNIRADQESEAIEQWNQIVKFCREVIILLA